MPNGYALCIGLNRVNPASYAGWDGKLSGCINDANCMIELLRGQGFAVKKLLDEDATAEAILGSIDDVARVMQPSDLLCVTYSGHGGQMRDPWGLYGTVDTLCAYDRQIIGHELGMLWSSFRSGSRVLFLSDSCHSGTVTRQITGLPPVAEPAKPATLGEGWSVGFPVVITKPREMEEATQDVSLPNMVPKTVPPEVQAQVEVQHRYLYRVIFRGLTPPTPACPVLLLSGCQSNQLSSDGPSNGLFTDRVLAVWNKGIFDGDYPLFHKTVVGRMPLYQTPNLFLQTPDLQGTETIRFMSSKPFTI